MAETAGAGLVGEWESIVHPLSTRDEIGFVVFNGRLWVIGSSVTPAGASGQEVFSTADGINWVEHGRGGWVGQRGPTTVVFNGYIYLVGNAMQDDIWRTNDPASGHWEKVLDDAPWGIRHGASVFVFDNKMWLMGGMRFSPEGWPVVGQPEYDSESFNDVWMSEDGVTWTQVLDEAPWGPRAHTNGGAAVLNGRMYVVSGGVITLQPFGSVRDHVGEPYRDVWSSDDGIHWTLETDHAPWTGRTFASLAVYQGQLVLMGGSIGTDHRDMDNDIWVSNDGGKTWTEGNFPGLPRHASGMISFNDDLYIAGGLQTDDMWRLNGPRQNPDQSASEDLAFNLTLDGTAFDTLPGSPTYTASLNDGSALPSWLHFDPVTLTFSGTPENGDVGTIVVVVQATGVGDAGAAMFRVTVDNTNDAPTGQTLEITVNPNGEFAFTDPSALFADVDVGDSLSAIRIETLPTAGTLMLEGDAVSPGQVIAAADLAGLKFAPALGGSGDDYASFSFTTQDQAGTFASAQSIITFNVASQAPAAQNSSVLVEQGHALTFVIGDFGFSDPNADDSLGGIIINTLPAWGQLTLSGTPVVAGQTISSEDIGNLVFAAPALASAGSTDLTFTVVDRGGLPSATPATLTIDVNRPPVVADVEIHIRQDRIFMPTEADFGFTDIDGADQFDAFRIESLPSQGRLLLNGASISVGQIIPAWKASQVAYIPLGTSNIVHQVEFEFSVRDSRGAFSQPATFTLIVDTIIYRDNVTGDATNNTLTGDMGNNWIDGKDGNDLLIPNRGDDVVDGGAGNDTVSFSAYQENLSLTLGSQYGLTSGVGIKWLWNIENVIGGSGNDYIIGDGQANRLEGRGGNDTIYGEGGDDLILPGLGTDYVHGGDGVDTVSFADLAVDVAAVLEGATIASAAGIKTISAVENLIGGNGNDHLTGDGLNNRLEGGLGNDVLTPGLGNDILDGGDGIDTVSFEGVDQNIGIWLAATAGQGTGAGIKWVWNVENLIGGNGNDHFIGDDKANRLEGHNGDDALYGEGGDDVLMPGTGHDYVHGGSGNDTVSFADQSANLTVSLGMTDSESGVGLKTLRAIENLIGGSGNDHLTGDGLNNRLEGGLGNDVLTPGLGNDILDGGDGIDTVSFEGVDQNIGIWLAATAGQGTGAGIKWVWNVENLIGGNGNDHFIGDDKANRLEGHNGDDALYGEGGDDVLMPGTGHDYVHGGSGNDTVSFADQSANLTVSLGMTDSESGVGLKTLRAIENLIGGSGNDHLTGDGLNNRLEGGLGNDTLRGGGGNDTFVYLNAAHSSASAMDKILDFSLGDVIDLTGIDANSGTGADDVFHYIGSDTFTQVAGELRMFENTQGVWQIEGDVNGDGLADLVISVTTDHYLTPVDLLL